MRKWIIYVGLALALGLGVACYNDWIDCDPTFIADSNKG